MQNKPTPNVLTTIALKQRHDIETELSIQLERGHIIVSGYTPGANLPFRTSCRGLTGCGDTKHESEAQLAYKLGLSEHPELKGLGMYGKSGLPK